MSKPSMIGKLLARLRWRSGPRIVPVIFANGEDDDLPGITAALENEPVQYGDRVYEAGASIIIRDVRLRFNSNVIPEPFHRAFAQPLYVSPSKRNILMKDIRVSWGRQEAE